MKRIQAILLIGVLVVSTYVFLNYDVKQNVNVNERVYSVVSVSLDSNYFYYFHLPYICLSWRRVGIEPIVILVSSSFSNLTYTARKTLEYLDKLGVKQYNLKVKKNYDRILSMHSRIFIGLLPNNFTNDEDYLITTDSDLLPLSSNYYNFFSNDDKIKVTNSDCCANFKFKLNEYKMYPMGCIGMKKWQWREVIELKKEETFDENTINASISRILGNEFIVKNEELVKGDAHWDGDQKLISIQIDKYIKKSKNHKIIFKKAIDRYFSVEKFRRGIRRIWLYNDAHVYLEDILSKWELMKLIFEKIFNRDTNILLNIYYSEFIKANSY